MNVRAPFRCLLISITPGTVHQLQFYLGLNRKIVVKWMLKIQELRMNWILLAVGDVVGTAVAQLVEALRYKSEGRGFDSRWCHWNFSLT